MSQIVNSNENRDISNNDLDASLPFNQDGLTAKTITPANERRWPSGSPSKNGAMAGHCMNND